VIAAAESMVGQARTSAARPRSAPLLDLDPDLGRLLPPESWALVHQDVVVRVAILRRGPWQVGRLASANAVHLGLLVIDGLLGRELLAEDVRSLELLGPGDLLCPWDGSANAELLQAVVRWSVLADTRLALLDRTVAGQMGRYPEMYSALLERTFARSDRLAVSQAICQFRRVDRRVLSLLWHLAERWGRMTTAGVAIPLDLSHRMLAQLVGARRPTVSTALGELARTGEVIRSSDGAWILTGDPVGAPDRRTSRSTAPRRAILGTSAVFTAQ
jgi:CRP-like cAMP-binding protein